MGNGIKTAFYTKKGEYKQGGWKMHSKNKIFTLVMVGIFLFCCDIIDASTYTCNSCVDCNNKTQLAFSGDTIYLTENISSPNQTYCILLNNKTKITLDCQGNHIIGSPQLIHGIRVVSGSNNTINDCVVLNSSFYGVGIYLEHSHNNILIDNKVQNNSYSATIPGDFTFTGAIYLNFSNNNIVQDNTIEKSPMSGIYLHNSSNNFLTGNTINNNKVHGIKLWHSHNNTLASNTADKNEGSGIEFQYSNNNTLRGNILVNNSGGINGDDFHNTIIENNKVNNQSGDGIILSRFFNSSITNNIANGNGYDGIFLYECFNNTIENNTANNNGYDIQIILDEVIGPGSGVHISYWGGNNTVVSNTLSNNSHYGIYIENTLGERNTLVGNIINNNKKCGIYIRYTPNTKLRDNRINRYAGQEGLRVSFFADVWEDAITRSYTDFYYFVEDIDASNTINGLPIEYYDGVFKACPNNEILSFSLSEQTVSHLQLVGCNNVTIRNLNTTSLDGLYLSFTNNSRIENCISNNNFYGIYLKESHNNTITNNTLNNNYGGIYIYYSDNNSILKNTANNNTFGGTHFYNSDGNNFTGNTIRDNNNGTGIYINNEGIQSFWSYEPLDPNILNSNIVCYNKGYDFHLLNVSMAAGNYNTCENTNGWNDASSSGCTYSCSISSSTTTSTTTTTLPGGCTLIGDNPPCGQVTLSEVVSLINKWSTGQATLQQVITLINAWAG